MIDDLDLAFDEYSDRGRHRHRRGAVGNGKNGKKKKKRRRRGRTFAALFVTLTLLATLGVGAWWGIGKVQGFFNAPDFSSAGSGEATVEVKKGDTAADIGNTLYSKGVIKSAAAFVEAAQADPRSQNIQPGVYKLRQRMRASAALDMLLDLKNKQVTRVTIPEGRTAKQTYELLAKATGLKAADFAAAAKDPIKLGIPDFWFTRTDKKPVTRSIEGFLFPSTYELDPGATAAEILQRMVGQFLAVAEEVKFVQRVEGERGGIAPYEALIVASLAQAEAGVPEDIGKIARVAYNRVYKKAMPLQFDVTVNYYWELTGKPTKSSAQMTTADLQDAKNPYSTHVHLGLPPTPINNPGRVALEGAMAPPEGTWLFFVAVDKAGHSAFATTDAEHERNKALACRNGVLC
ncbi:MAG TPA: endolytic transglycosylase MltG [Micromonosporaceae bacterium]|nr:endolytic transglycosylase MltG [Micromonosporaceae bacterium]